MAHPSDGRTLADKLDTLIKTVQPLRREYTNDEVARGCTEVGQGTFSKTYVWQLRTGQRDNPTKRHLEALAAFFGVPATYFFDDDTAARVDSQLALATALRDAGIRDAALRISNLDDANRQSILRIVQEITQMYSPASDDRPTAVEPEHPQQ
ncbi:MAG: helix-turn-helix domain-containing protein [Pseudonocardiaceae bacterium]